MKFLTDENIPLDLVKALRKEGHDVKDVKEEKLTGSYDRSLFELAKKEERAIITLDKDFEHIATTLQDAAHGIILLRYKRQTSLEEKFTPIIEKELKGKTKDRVIRVSEDMIKIKKMK